MAGIENEKKLIDTIKDKRVLFISPKNTDYIRIVQAVNIIGRYSKSLNIISSYKKSYLLRLPYVYFKLLFTSTSKYDVVFIGFTPQLILPIFRFKFRKNFVIEDFFISLYDTCCLDRKYFNPKGIIGRFIHYLDAKTLSLGDMIMTDTHTHLEYFVKEFNVTTEKIYTLYLEVKISPSLKKDKSLVSTDKYRVLYFGSILPLQGVEIIFESMRLLQYDPRVHFIFIGPLNKKLEKLAPISSNITYINWLPEDKLYNEISSSNLCLAGHFSSQIAKASRVIPGKAYIYHALKKPMILGDNPANHEQFDESYKEIYYVPMGDSIALTKQIIQCVEDSMTS